MDRTTEDSDGVTVYSDPSHNEATETFTMVFFDRPQSSSNPTSELDDSIFTNPGVIKVYRWLTRAHTTIDVTGVFQVAGKQSIIIKGGSTGVKLTSVDVTPVNPSVAVGATQQFTAAGAFSDGSIESPLSGVTFTALTPSIATIDSSGLATVDNTASAGDVAIFTVTRNGAGDSFTLTVQ